MKVMVDGEMVCELNDTQKKVIMNDIMADEFDADMKRRVNYILMHKYERCFERLKKEWEPRLAESHRAISSVPLDRDAFAELVFSQSDYKDRQKREKESEKRG